MSVHDAEHLLADVLGAFHGPLLDEVFHAPGAREVVVLPGVVDAEKGQVVAFHLVESGLSLVCLLDF